MIKIRINGDKLCEFQESELAAWQDDGEPDFHVYRILCRHNGMIEIKNRKELNEVWVALCSGTFQLHYYRCACRIAEELLKHTPERRRWKYPTGS